MKFISELPPRVKRNSGNSKWPAIVAACKQHCGEWTHVRTSPTQKAAYHIAAYARKQGLKAATRGRKVYVSWQQ